MVCGIAFLVLPIDTALITGMITANGVLTYMRR